MTTKTYINPIDRLALRTVLAAYNDRGRKMRENARKASGAQRAAQNRHKAWLGDHARHYQLALALLTGRAYAEVEYSTRNPPNARRLAALVGEYGNWEAKAKFDEKGIRAWLATPATPELVAKREAARKAACERASTARAIAKANREAARAA